VKYIPLIRETDKPAVHLNREIVAKYRTDEEVLLRPDEVMATSEQLGIEYPTVRPK
jgi:aminobenzoyl-glutamate utilization protein B